MTRFFSAPGVLCFSLALPLLGGCAEVTYEREDSTFVSLCLNGAGAEGHSGNLVVSDLCAELPGLIRPCDDEGCGATFGFSDDQAALEALVAEVARNDARGQRSTIAILGYSWGACNAAGLADRFAHDERVPLSDRHIDRLVTIDAFCIPILDVIDVSPFVYSAWNYRHSVAPDDTCAERPLIGRYTGRPLNCAGDTRCVEHDFSTAPGGAEIDHCTVTDVSAGAALANLRHGLDGDGAFVTAARQD